MKLNPEQTWNELHLLMGNVEPVLLCWEKPGEFCHRQLVELGISIEEYDPRATPQFDLF
ncbi:hypothetical protein N4Q70_16695 [Salmonella enterica subsp. enterica serovar Weltevreden]|uniref:hypothetical protein n=1 Tax=Salmonella enterica TaxID=28901 RepID=UPI003731E5F9